MNKLGYTAVDIKAAALAHAYFAEAKKYYDAECSSDSAINTSALFMFSMACTYQGKDPLALKVLDHGRQMAARLGLFGLPRDDPKALALQNMPPDLARMTAHVAWGGYNWLT